MAGLAVNNFSIPDMEKTHTNTHTHTQHNRIDKVHNQNFVNFFLKCVRLKIYLD